MVYDFAPLVAWFARATVVFKRHRGGSGQYDDTLIKALARSKSDRRYASMGV
jgi:hypothetical protein